MGVKEQDEKQAARDAKFKVLQKEAADASAAVHAAELTQKKKDYANELLDKKAAETQSKEGGLKTALKEADEHNMKIKEKEKKKAAELKKKMDDKKKFGNLEQQ